MNVIGNILPSALINWHWYNVTDNGQVGASYVDGLGRGKARKEFWLFVDGEYSNQLVYSYFPSFLAIADRVLFSRLSDAQFALVLRDSSSRFPAEELLLDELVHNRGLVLPVSFQDYPERMMAESWKGSRFAHSSSFYKSMASLPPDIYPRTPESVRTTTNLLAETAASQVMQSLAELPVLRQAFDLLFCVMLSRGDIIGEIPRETGLTSHMLLSGLIRSLLNDDIAMSLSMHARGMAGRTLALNVTSLYMEAIACLVLGDQLGFINATLAYCAMDSKGSLDKRMKVLRQAAKPLLRHFG